MLTVDAKRPKKLVNDVVHFLCILSTRRNTVHFNYVPSGLQLELWMGWKCFSCIEFWIYLHIRSFFKRILLYRGRKIMFTAFPIQFKIVPLLSDHFSKSRGWPLEVAGNSSQYFSRLRVWWVIIAPLYLLTPTSWYQQTVQSLANKLLLIFWHNRLP